MNMLGSIPHQKFCFYHLPTRGRAGINLGDADTSPTYLYFLIVPRCYIIILWCFTIILYHFLVLTYWHSAQCQFLFFPCFRVSQKRKIKRSPIDLKFHGTYFWKQSNLMDLECTSAKKRGSHEAGGAPTPLGRALHPRGPLVAPLTYFFLPYIPIYLKNFGEHDRSGVPPP